jgi:hypothetical protein
VPAITIKRSINMTYKEIIINFMLKKDAIIKKHTGIDLVDQNDLDELTSWTETTHTTIALNFSWIPSGMCPWCIINKYVASVSDCEECGYGKRHGICGSRYSRFDRIIDSIALSHGSLYDLPGMTNLILNTIQEIIDKYKEVTT